MTGIQAFAGHTLCKESLLLGEGPTYDPATDTAWWFNILGRELHELQLGSGRKSVHPLPFMASVLARIDAGRQMIASENGLHVRDVASGGLTLVTPIEADRPATRSNDGRVHPSGALWLGTMGKGAEDKAGAIYHVARGVVSVIVGEMTIPNGICFSPDGTIGYYVDTMKNRYMRVPLDPATGLPAGEARVFSDQSGEPGGVDGSVCGADGTIYNARWGVGEIQAYDPQGRKIARYKVPARQTTCPAFVGAHADRMLVTSAREGLDGAALAADPAAGRTFEMGMHVNGVFDTPYRM